MGSKTNKVGNDSSAARQPHVDYLGTYTRRFASAMSMDSRILEDYRNPLTYEESVSAIDHTLD